MFELSLFCGFWLLGLFATRHRLSKRAVWEFEEMFSSELKRKPREAMLTKCGFGLRLSPQIKRLSHTARKQNSAVIFKLCKTTINISVVLINIGSFLCILINTTLTMIMSMVMMVIDTIDIILVYPARRVYKLQLLFKLFLCSCSYVYVYIYIYI